MAEHIEREEMLDKWIEGCCEIICPKCNAHIKDEIAYMCYDWKGIYPPYCPNCGKKLNVGEQNERL